MTFSIDNPRGLQQPPLGKYVWENPSGEQGLILWKTNKQTNKQKTTTHMVRKKAKTQFLEKRLQGKAKYKT